MLNTDQTVSNRLGDAHSSKSFYCRFRSPIASGSQNLRPRKSHVAFAGLLTIPPLTDNYNHVVLSIPPILLCILVRGILSASIPFVRFRLDIPFSTLAQDGALHMSCLPPLTRFHGQVLSGGVAMYCTYRMGLAGPFVHSGLKESIRI